MVSHWAHRDRGPQDILGNSRHRWHSRSSGGFSSEDDMPLDVPLEISVARSLPEIPKDDGSIPSLGIWEIPTRGWGPGDFLLVPPWPGEGW